MRSSTFTPFLLAFVLLAGALHGAPNAATSEYLKTTGGGINISAGNQPLSYSLILQVRKKIDTPLYVRSFFERPGDAEKPLVADSVLASDKSRLFVDSPSFQGIENGRTYSVTTVLYADEKREKEVSRHTQEIQFNVPKKAFKKLGLKKP